MSQSSVPNVREHIVDVAARLFYREGTKSVGVDRIILETGVAKATMYRHFPSKDALIATCLQQRHDQVFAALCEGMQKSRVHGARKALRMFDLLHAKANSPQFRGCAFMLAVAENEISEEVRSIARMHKQAVLQLFEDALPAEWPARSRLAAQLNLLYDGALAQILISRDPQVALVARECAGVLLEHAGPRADGP